MLGELVAKHLPGVTWAPPQATYLSWLGCAGLGLANPSALFLESARVAVNDGADFGTGGAGHVRLNYATSAAILTEAVERMGRAISAQR